MSSKMYEFNLYSKMGHLLMLIFQNMSRIRPRIEKIPPSESRMVISNVLEKLSENKMGLFLSKISPFVVKPSKKYIFLL